MEPGLHPNVQRIQTYDFYDHDEETLKRLCREVPCAVDLSACNVVTWFDEQVQRKVQKSSRWRIYLDKTTTESFLKRKGSFLYEKYLASRLCILKRNSQRKLLRVVLFSYMQEDKNGHPETDECSMNTIFDTSTLFDSCRSLPTISQDKLSIAASQDFHPFEYDLDIITSTQKTDGSI